MIFLKRLFPIDDFKKTIKRFPLSALCCVFLCALLILSVHDVIKIEDDGSIYFRLVTLAECGYFWFGAVRLLTEGFQKNRLFEMSIGGAGFAVLAGLTFFGGGVSLLWFLGLLVPALFLLISIAPYIKGDDSLSFWFYNRQIWQGASIAVLAGLLWGAGISAAFASVDYLFGVDVASEAYADLWIFSLTIFAPLYALAWVPETFKFTEADCHAPPQLAFVLNWVLAPLILVYMLILYAYFIKIGLSWELPRGQLSYMVGAFGGVGVLTYLAGWPLRESGGPMLRLVYKLFFPALLIPVGMQALSIYMRIEQYGVTEQRYLVVVSVIWFAVLAVIYSVRKAPLKIMPGILAALLLFASLGPLSAPNVAMRSQVSRLEKLLVDNEVLINGRIKRAENEISFADRKSISSILDFLRDRKELERIKPWFEGIHVDTAFRDKSPSLLTQLMGFSFIERYHAEDSESSFYLNNDSEYLPMDVVGYDYLLRSNYKFSEKEKRMSWVWPADEKTGMPVIKGFYDGSMFVVDVSGYDVLRFDVREAVRKTRQSNANKSKHDIVLLQEGQGAKAKLIVDNIGGKSGQDNIEVNSISFHLLVGLKK